MGGDGNDTLTGGDGADQLDGGAGKNFADYTGSSAAVTINLSDTSPEVGGSAQGDTLFNIHVWGSTFADSLTRQRQQ